MKNEEYISLLEQKEVRERVNYPPLIEAEACKKSNKLG